MIYFRWSRVEIISGQKVCNYDESTSQREEFQNLKRHVSEILAIWLGISSSNVYFCDMLVSAARSWVHITLAIPIFCLAWNYSKQYCKIFIEVWGHVWCQSMWSRLVVVRTTVELFSIGLFVEDNSKVYLLYQLMRIRGQYSLLRFHWLFVSCYCGFIKKVMGLRRLRVVKTQHRCGET